MLGLKPGDLRFRHEELTPFVCNVCGAANRLPTRRLTREDGHCTACNCYGRLRAMMYAVTDRFSPDQLILARMSPKKHIRGIGCSDWGYDKLLGEKFDYVNSFYDREPRLDLHDVDWSAWKPESFDFITCTDVLEHIVAPIETTFENMRRLLKPGGAAFITVPTTLDPETLEHFPNLEDWSIVAEGKQHVLVNRRRDGTVERFDDLCFHGGEGMTLEFRRFSRAGLLESVRRAGLRAAKIHERSIDKFAVPLCEHNFVLVAEKPAHNHLPGAAG